MGEERRGEERSGEREEGRGRAEEESSRRRDERRGMEWRKRGGEGGMREGVSRNVCRMAGKDMRTRQEGVR